MSLDSNARMPSRGRPGQDLWPKWMWVAVPVLVVVVVAGLWWAIFSPSDKPAIAPTPSPTMRVLRTQPTQGPTLQSTLVPLAELTPTGAVVTATKVFLPIPSTFTPTPPTVITPMSAAATPTQEATFAIGVKVKVTGTGGVGLQMRAGAGTAQARIKTLPDGATLEIIGGPKDANNLTWWQVRDETGTTGWVASRYLTR